jgi:hypothetical protein
VRVVLAEVNRPALRLGNGFGLRRKRLHADSKPNRGSFALPPASLASGQGKAQQGRELLAPVYGWFTEGFDPRDLKEGKALVEELAA